MSPEKKKCAREALDKLHGRGAYAYPGNLCYGDGYFARSIEQEFGMSINELEKEINYGG